MKYSLTPKNGHKIRNQISLTEDEENLISKKDFDENDKKKLKEIKEKRYSECSQNDIDIINSIYNKYKPVTDGDYQLIAFDINVNEEGKARGILNCRVNNEHKQIRINEF